MSSIFDSLNRLDYVLSKLPSNLDLYLQIGIIDSNSSPPVEFSTQCKIKEMQIPYWDIVDRLFAIEEYFQ
jgi:hypothetical protein